MKLVRPILGAITAFLVYVAATPYLPQPDAHSQFLERAVACLADAVIPSADAATFGPVDAFTPAFGGRCTLVSVTPVMTANATSATVVYYTPYISNRVAIPTSTGKLVNWVFPESSNISTNSSVGSAGPVAVAANSVYDFYEWQCGASTLCLTRSPAWASATSRGSGAGTAQQDCTTVPGVCTNAVAITNGPAAFRGTHVCTGASDVGSTFDWQYGAIATGGTQGLLNLWNRYNRVNVSTLVGDSAVSWTYAGTAYRSANTSNTMRVTYVAGAAEDDVDATYGMHFSTVGNRGAVAIGVDVTNAFSGIPGAIVSATQIMGVGHYVGQPGSGSHFIQAIEYCSASQCTFLGNGTLPTVIGSGLQVRLRQ